MFRIERDQVFDQDKYEIKRGVYKSMSFLNINLFKIRLYLLKTIDIGRKPRKIIEEKPKMINPNIKILK